MPELPEIEITKCDVAQNFSPLEGDAFARTLIDWQKQEGRQHLPWQFTGDAYKVWLSEVMLQQTQVSTVLMYYARFLEIFPSVRHLAGANDAEVMRLWAGLGYYSRARNLHACAKQVVDRFDGIFPQDPVLLESLPGIGRSTAGAIASLAYGVKASIMDGNVKRVFCRYYAIEGYSEHAEVKRRLWLLAESNVPRDGAGVYNQALMDLGAMRCTPKGADCGACPLRSSCQALRKGMVGLLPTPKPKKARPLLYFVVLLLEDALGRFALHLQQDKGIWRDLWIPPLMPVVADMDLDLSQCASMLLAWSHSDSRIQQVSLAQLVPRWSRLKDQPWMVHELTHRKMHFKVLHLMLDCVDSRFNALTDLALPRVVHKLIDHARIA